jgi:hypothetical protein
MAMIDIKINPTARDLKIFGAMLLVFFIILGKIAFSTEHALLYAALFTGTCFLISIALNNDFPKKTQMLGLIIPLMLLGIWGFDKAAVASGNPALNTVHVLKFWPRLEGIGAQWLVFFIVAAIGVLGGIAIFASRSLGAAIYRTWMFAALPIGWTISHGILGIVFFLVLTPIGLIMRAMGKDSMGKSFDPKAATYWIPHAKAESSKRYFQQF